MKVLVDAFNQEKALVGTFSVIVESSRTFGLLSFQALLRSDLDPGGRRQQVYPHVMGEG